MSENAIEQYLESLKAMGLPDDAIAVYRKQMELSIQTTNQWAGQLNQFEKNIQQFNAMYTGNGAHDRGISASQPIVLNTNTTLNRREQWAIACGADIAFLNGEYLNDLSTGLSKEVCRHILSEWWDIDSKEETIEQINWLFTEGHRIQFDIIRQAMMLLSIKESKEFIREHVATNEMEEEVAIERLRNMRDAFELFSEHNLIGDTQPDMLIWDYARIINLSRGCFDAQYLSEKEAMDFIMNCVDPVRRTYTSWKELSVSYQFGRCVWNGIDKDIFGEMKTAMQLLLTDTKSPWVIMKWDEQF